MGLRTAKLGVKRKALQCLFSAALSLGMIGCASMEDSLYFKAIPRDADGNASANYYRVDIKASGSLAKSFKVRSGYVSVDTIDALSGQTPSIPIADKTREEYAAFSAAKKSYQEKMVKLSEEMTLTDPQKIDDFVISQARLAWLAGLSDADFKSIAQTEDLNPYGFRKLVFYATVEDLNLTSYGKQVDDAMDKAGALAKNARDQREARKKEKQLERKTQMDAVNKLLPQILGDNIGLDAEGLKSLMGLLFKVPIDTDVETTSSE